MNASMSSSLLSVSSRASTGRLLIEPMQGRIRSRMPIVLPLSAIGRKRGGPPMPGIRVLMPKGRRLHVATVLIVVVACAVFAVEFYRHHLL